MLFNSYSFILAFLPAAVLGFYALGRTGISRASVLWLVACSLFFYAYWKPIYLVLLLFSIGFNFAAGIWLGRLAERQDPRRWLVLAVAVGEELAMLGFFKYANFFVDNVNAATGADITLTSIVLPLGISFYTFQQIAYLVDTARGEIRLRSFLDYSACVSFFPHLIAGPIILYREILPQFAAPSLTRFDHRNFALGITYFVVGLSKKVVIADWMALYATPVFSAAEEGIAPTLIEAWGGALAYTLQLYFDFSGYSDMAIGLGLMFNIRLPINFNSPYKAVNIIDFWRRWHITLSYFLRHYLYESLGGSRHGPGRRLVNILVTMLLAGLWHGAGWTFVAWGLFHGVLLSINHVWLMLRAAIGYPAAAAPSPWGAWVGRAVTLLAVVIGWVVFRAHTFEGAELVLRGMVGLNGVHLSSGFEGALSPLLRDLGVTFGPVNNFFGASEALGIVALCAVALFAPNSHQLLGYEQQTAAVRRAVEPRLTLPLRWAPTSSWAVVVGLAFVFVLTQLSNISEFLYFQF
jgi:D-alanyl-lipoteichoic acid acyltransferase DltB (MBOAT superfamily)